jgi:hypothetical protein
MRAATSSGAGNLADPKHQRVQDIDVPESIAATEL